MTTIRSKRNLYPFTGAAALVLTLILSACGGGGGGGGTTATPGGLNLTGAVTTLLDDGTFGFFDGTGTAAQFAFPTDIISDDTNLYVADTNNHRIRQIDLATGEVTTLAGRFRGFFDGTGTAAEFFAPRGITTDGTNLYVADTFNNHIRRIQ